MPVKRVTSKLPKQISKTKKTTKSTKVNISKAQHNLQTQQSILDILNRFSESRNAISKSQNNLPAKLMKMRSSRFSKQRNIENYNTNTEANQDMFSKSISSSFSSVMKDGHTHSEGKTIINNSNKPFIEIKEMENGHINQYMVPKNTIPYKPISRISRISSIPKHKKISKQKSKGKKKLTKNPKGKKKSTKK